MAIEPRPSALQGRELTRIVLTVIVIGGLMATTIMIPQMIAPRNGRRIQNVAAIRPPITSTVSTMRVSSRPWSSDRRTYFAFGLRAAPSSKPWR